MHSTVIPTLLAVEMQTGLSTISCVSSYPLRRCASQTLPNQLSWHINHQPSINLIESLNSNPIKIPKSRLFRSTWAESWILDSNLSVYSSLGPTAIFQFDLALVSWFSKIRKSSRSRPVKHMKCSSLALPERSY